MLSFGRRVGAVAMIVGLIGSVDGCVQTEDARAPLVVAADGTGTVSSIIDGDTLSLEVDGVELRVRLTGIDTPEVHPELQCFGADAERALAELAPLGAELSFVYDQDQRDRYDRELLYLYTTDGIFINLALVEQGAARAVLFEPNDLHWVALRAAEAAARDAGRGLWGAC